MSDAGGGLPSRSRRRLLLIDADAPMLRTAEHTLDVHEFEITMLPSPWVAPTELDPSRFALVVVNAGAQESGAAAKFCEALHQAVACPLIVVAPHGPQGTRRQCEAAGAPPLIGVRGCPELSSALRTMLGSSVPHQRVLRAGPLRLDLHERQIALEGEPLVLSPEEFAVCSRLIEHEGFGVAAEQLVPLVSSDAGAPQRDKLAACIARLRALLATSSARILDRSGTEFLLTVIPLG